MNRSKKSKLLIINRSFWPDSLIQGEALLNFAESASIEYHVTVAAQLKADLRSSSAVQNRGEGIIFRTTPAFSTSKSHVIVRILEGIFFMIWVVWCLLITRPNKIYVSTNPPILVPFVSFLYTKLFKADLYYHLQDIHPEAMNTSIPINKYIFSALQRLDGMTMRGARSLITITDVMAKSIRQRSQTTVPIHLLDNPAYQHHIALDQPRDGDVVFCGNLGRFQRIPTLATAIDQYLQRGGELHFTFIGDGIHAAKLDALADKHSNVSYLGRLPANEASLHIARHKWSLLPIEDEVMLYAFPSKTSAYVLAGCRILAICGNDTGVADWVRENQVGIVVEPDVETVVQALNHIQAGRWGDPVENANLYEKLTIKYYVSELLRVIKTEALKHNPGSKHA